MVINRNDQYIGRCLSDYGEFSFQEIRLLCSLINRESLVLDIGANFGALTVPLAQRAGLVMAFEPQPFVFHCLCANIALNSLTNVHPMQAAVATQAGQIPVPLIDPNHFNNFGALNLFMDAPNKTLVPSIRIDDLNIPRCDLIKCDVEGMEEIALRSGLRVLHEHRPALYLENDRTENAESLLEFLASTGRRLFRHEPLLVEENNFVGNPNPFVDADGKHFASLNILAWPAERKLPIKPEDFELEEISLEESASHQRENVCEPVP